MLDIAGANGRELRSYPQVSKYILVDIIFDFEGLFFFIWTFTWRLVCHYDPSVDSEWNYIYIG